MAGAGESSSPTRRRPNGSSVRLGCSTSPSEWRARFVAKISKVTSRILSTLRACRLKMRVCPAAPPRSSRRIAGFDRETPGGGAPSRSKKKVMRVLNITGPTEGLTRRAWRNIADFSPVLPHWPRCKSNGGPFWMGNTGGLGGDGCCLLASPLFFSSSGRCFCCLRMNPSKILCWNVRGLNSEVALRFSAYFGSLL